MKNLYLILILFSSSLVLHAQYRIGLVPRSSPDCGVYQKIGYTEIEVRYGSPAVKGRELWGELVPWGKVWRAGANNATTIRFSQDVWIADQVLPADTYALFVIPRELEPWTVIFSNKDRQWGAFSYDEADDALRVNAYPETAAFTENLNYRIDQLGFDHGRISLNWGQRRINIQLRTNYLDLFAQQVEEGATTGEHAGSWVSWIQGAEYLERIQQRLPLALEWLDLAETASSAEAEWNAQYYPRHYVEGNRIWVRAKVLAGLERYAEALTEVEALKQLVASGNYYEKKNEAERIDEHVNRWQEQ